MQDWKGEMLRGFNWNFANQIINKVVSFGFGIFLARLLYPQDFGLIAMAAVFLGFAEIFKDFGISSAIVQRKEITASELDTSFWLTVIMGFFMASLLVLCASPIAFFYQEPLLIVIIKVLALNLFLSSLGLVHIALLTKALNFKSIFFISVTAEVISAILAILAALAGWNFWSILIKLLSRTCLQLVILWSSSAWKPSFKLSKKNVRPLLEFAFPLVGTQSMNYWVRHLDDLLIGKFHGDQTLGIYDRGYAFLLLPLGQIKGIVGKVAFPFFAGIQTDIVRVRKYFLKMTRLVALFSFPFMSVLYLIADDLVLIMLGEKWRAVVEPLKVFALTGILQSVVILIGVLFVSQGQTKLQFYLVLITSLIGVISIVVGLNWGIIGVAWGLFVATLINLGPNIYFAGSIIGLSFFRWVTNLLGVALCTILMVLGLSLIQNLIVIEVIWFRLLLWSLIGGLLYVLSAYVFRIQAYEELIWLTKGLVNGKN